MSPEDFDDEVASLGSVGSDVNAVNQDPDILYFIITDEHCAQPHQSGSYF